MKKSEIIKLGDKVKDRITGYEGIAVARIEYLNGCIQIGVKARVKAAALKEAEYIDENQLDVTEAGAFNRPVIEEEKRPYGDQPDRPRKKNN